MVAGEGGLSARLGQMELFNGLSLEELEALARLFEAGHCNQGAQLCREGHQGGSLYIIERGRVRVAKRTDHGFDEALKILGPGSVVGEMALLDGLPISATVTVMEPSRVLRLSARSFAALRLQAPSTTGVIVRNLCQILCRRLRGMNDQIRALKSDPNGLRQRILQARSGQRALSNAPAPVSIPSPNITPHVPQGQNVQAQADFLGQLTIFKHMSDRELRVLAGAFRAQISNNGDVICREGERGDKLYVVTSGFVNVYKTQSDGVQGALTMLPPGTLFGEVSLVDEGRRSASCVASGQVGLLVLSRDDFEALFTAKTPLSVRFVEALALDLSVRLRVVQAQFASIFALSVTNTLDFDDGEGQYMTDAQVEAFLKDVESELNHIEGNLGAGVLTTQELDTAVMNLFD